MNTNKQRQLIAFAVVLVAILGAKCPSIPEIREAVVQLVKTESTVVGPFLARGNDVADDGSLDLVAEYDIAGKLDEANIGVQDVETITVRKVEVRVSKPDPEPTRTITGGTVRARLAAGSSADDLVCPAGGPFQPVVTGWSGVVNNFQTFAESNVMIESSGIDLLNCILNVYLTALRNGENPDPLVVEWEVDGVTDPPADADFDWEVRVTIDIVGEITTDVIG